jgi:uncharacterized ParB-like nuclease family protein
MKKPEPVKIKGEVMWAFLDTPNKLSGKHQLDICNLSEEAVRALQEKAMLDVNHKDGKGFYITPKSNYEIKAFDDTGKQLTDIKIANGSKCTAVIKPYINKFNKGVNASITAITVTDLIEYTPDAAQGSAAMEAL